MNYFYIFHNSLKYKNENFNASHLHPDAHVARRDDAQRDDVAQAEVGREEVCLLVVVVGPPLHAVPGPFPVGGHEFEVLKLNYY